MARKQALSRITDSVGHAPKPDVEAYEKDQEMIDDPDGEEKRAEEMLAQAKKTIRRNSTQTLTLLAEVREIRARLDSPPE